MDHRLLEKARRAFNAEQHIVSFGAQEWLPLFEENGAQLVGIRGKEGAFGLTIEGHEIGGDLIQMQPGSSFGTHVHPGDHLLYCIKGEGQVYIDGELRPWEAGDTVFIAADYPHGVTTYDIDHFRRKGFHCTEELGRDLASGREVCEMRDGGRDDASFVILAVGVPHKHVDAKDRMHRVRTEQEEHELIAKAKRDWTDDVG